MKITDVGKTITTTGSAERNALPAATGVARAARAVRVVSNTIAYIKFGGSSVDATDQDIMVNTVPSVFDVSGCTHYSVIQGTAGALINITPIR